MRELEGHPSSGVTVLLHHEIFAHDADDVDWLPLLRRHGADILITSDGRMRRSPEERRAWLEAQILTYFLSPKFAGERAWSQTEELIRWWPLVKLHAKTAPAGSAWSLPWNERKPRALEHPGDGPSREAKGGLRRHKR